MSAPPREHALERHVERLNARLYRLDVAGVRIALARLVVFVAGAVVSVALLVTTGVWIAAIAAAAGLVGFLTLAHFHGRIKNSTIRHHIWRDIKRAHLARARLDWDSLPPPLIAEPRPDHPLELDLDLTGPRGIHRLLDTSVSREGSLRLRDWLAAGTPDPGAIARRQALVRELAAHALFRDRLQLSALLAAKGKFRRWDGAALLDWLASFAPSSGLKPWLWGLTALSLTTLALLALDLGAGLLPPLWRYTLLVYAGLYVWKMQRTGDLFQKAFALSDPLTNLKAVFEHLERDRYGDTPALRALCAPFLDPANRPSAHLRRITRVLAAASVRGNPYLWFVANLVMPWDLWVAHWLEQRKAAVARLMPEWLDVWYELEALGALATFADLNPDYAFPTVTAQPDGPALAAGRVGHPLIPRSARVCNDFALSRLGEVALITGSNMSGKSTFVRTLGVNLCLAYAGGPVVAREFTTAPLRVATCIRVTDSVTDGISYFYAEVKRLKVLLDALQESHAYPLFFLIDEIFRGTNNRERLIGSRAYIRAVAGKNGVGVLSTHDLELVKLADEIPHVHNYHFAETVAGGRMTFDYTLRPGPSPTSNALKIMAMEGLPVDGMNQHELEESPAAG